MLRNHEDIYKQVLQLIDLPILMAALFLAHFLRVDIIGQLPGVSWPRILPFTQYLWLYLIIIPTAPLFLQKYGIYRLVPRQSFGEFVWNATKGIFSTIGVLFAVVFLLRIDPELTSRSVLLLYWPIAVGLLFVREIAFRRWQSHRPLSSHRTRHVMIVAPENVRLMWKDLLNQSPGLSFDVCFESDIGKMQIPDFIHALHQNSVGVLIVTPDASGDPIGREMLAVCEAEGVEVWMTAELYKSTFVRPRLDSFHGHPLLVYKSAHDLSWGLIIKSIVDRLGAAMLLLILFPIIIMVAAAIAFSSAGPVMFRQKRSGIYGKPFWLYKFRTMVADAERKRDELGQYNEMDGPVFKMDNDPRIIPIGHFLRKYSLDELPQLWNVLKGEMSLVGPRPLPISETARFSELNQRRRLSVKPGLTCLWQISGRNNIRDFNDWVKLDLEYIDNWSLGLDFIILLRTIPAVLFGWGSK